jgi:parallel beta-helix repeat protein
MTNAHQPRLRVKNFELRLTRYHRMSREGVWLRCAIMICFFACWQVGAGLYVNTVSPGNIPWPGGTVPYVIDSALSAAQQQTYLNALREYELAANVHFILRTNQVPYILFKYDPNGFDQVSGNGNPQIVSVSLLTRAQICHEMGHSFGLLHEHTRSDQPTHVDVLRSNIAAANQHWFDVDPNGVSQGSYDFESVMHFPRDLFSTQPGVLDTLQAKSGYEKFQPRMGGLALSQGDRAVMKFLYGAGPTLSSVVTNTSESGVGGLRAALHYATDNPGTTITFNIPTTDPGYANGVFTIKLTGHLLPLVADGTVIDGTTQPGYAGSPLIVLDGSQILPEAGAVPATVPGLTVYSASSSVRGLSIQRFPWVGIAFNYSDSRNNSVRGCRIGLDYTGNAAAPNQYSGIYIINGANNNTIGGTTAADRNVLSGNSQYGVWISGPTTTGNIVLGNYIGTTANGLAALPNAFGGIIITDSSHNNVIGGSASGAQNVISGNTNAGVWLTGAGVNANTVSDNYIGLAANGSAAVPNTFAGMYIIQGAQNNLVANNIISGNTNEGLRMSDVGTSGNMVQGNKVGTTPNGTSALANGFAGVTIYSGATNNTVGGTLPSQRNILSGNSTVGLVFSDAGTSGNIAEGNFIGTDPTGSAAVPNGFAGVYIVNGATTNQLGAGQPGLGNLISGNAGYGILVGDPGTNSNLIRGNFIGTNFGGSIALPNSYAGIRISNGAQSNVIGGSALGASNIISGNANDGIVLYDANTNKNWITQNSIFSNQFAGIDLSLNTNNNQPAPIITSAVISPTVANAGGIDIGGSFNGSASSIEFFASPAGNNEGQFFVGSANVGGGGNFSVSLPAAVPKNYVITATATDADGNASQFSSPQTVTTTLDSNNDGIPDNWATAHSFSTMASIASQDTDGDGLTNLQEFLAGTDPRDPTNRFAVTSTDISTGAPRVGFKPMTGKTYQMEYRDDLIMGSWTTLLDGIFATSNSIIQVSDPSGTGLTKRFYRITLEP